MVVIIHHPRPAYQLFSVLTIINQAAAHWEMFLISVELKYEYVDSSQDQDFS